MAVSSGYRVIPIPPLLLLHTHTLLSLGRNTRRPQAHRPTTAGRTASTDHSHITCFCPPLGNSTIMITMIMMITLHTFRPIGPRNRRRRSASIPGCFLPGIEADFFDGHGGHVKKLGWQTVVVYHPSRSSTEGNRRLRHRTRVRAKRRTAPCLPPPAG